jgi:hypothetical protein
MRLDDGPEALSSNGKRKRDEDEREPNRLQPNST